MAKKRRKRRNKESYKLIVVAAFLLIILAILIKAPNYEFDHIPKETIRFVCNTEEMTENLSKKVIRDEQGEIYVSIEDVRKIWDKGIYFDAVNSQIVTSTDKKLATMKLDEKIISINSSKVETYAGILLQDGTYYLPIQEFSSVYNIEVRYIAETNTVTVDSLDERYLIANSKKNMGIKWIQDDFSKNVDTVERGNALILDIHQDLNEKWLKVRTTKGKVGYVKKKQISNISTLREELIREKQIEGSVYLFIDEFESAAKAPNRTGEPFDQKINAVAPTILRIQKNDKSNLRSNIGKAGENYVAWAHNQEYKVWPMLTNPSMEETTASVLADYAVREKLINDIVSAVLKYNFDGITIRFESGTNHENFTRFLSELSPRLKEIGKVLVLDKTKMTDYDTEAVKDILDYVITESYADSKMIVLN